MSSAPAPALAVAQARRYCETLARTHYENFTVVSAFFPKEKRQDMYNVYAFCRYSDDLGDEDVGQGDRLAALERWDAAVDEMYAGRARHPILVALRETVDRYAIPPAPFHDLIHAFKLDQTNKRWETFADVLHYCKHSANPVGRLVLHVFEEAREETFRLADETCTGLQLANFWQDVRRDYEDNGRIYIPQEDMRRFAYTEADLAAGVADDRWRALLSFEVDRARGFFERGFALLPLVRRELRVDLELFGRGGLAVLRAIERRRYDVFSKRPAISKRKKLWLVLRALLKLKLRLG